MRIAVASMVIVFLVGMALWLFLFRIGLHMLDDIRKGLYQSEINHKVVSKYDDCIKLEIPIHNVTVFVEKILENEKIHGLRLKEWERFAGSLRYIVALIGLFFSFFMRENVDELYVCLAVAAMCFVALGCMDRLTDVKGYCKDTVTQLVDYLENSGQVRVQEGRVMAEKLKGRAASDFMKMNKWYDKISAAQAGK